MVQLVELSNIKEVVEQILKAQPPHQNSTPLPEFVNSLIARQILGGGNKPISKPTFNKIRREKNIKTYHSSTKRILFSRAEIIQTIKDSSK